MMSLFSPFDYFFFSLSIFLFPLLFFLLTSLFFMLSSSNFVLNNVSSYLSKFFCSLKAKGMNSASLLLFMTVFISVFVMNSYSVFSFSFPLTSQVSLVLFSGLGIWVSLVMFTLGSSYKKLFYHFIPEGTPIVLVPLLFAIELVSNIIRPFTLMVRLVANILAGHLLMILLSSLVFLFPLSFPLYVVLNLIELFVSLIQAYIFVTILSLYFSEV